MTRARITPALLALLSFAVARGALCGELRICVIDVGQGSSELIIGPDGTSILIDGGTSAKGTSDVIPYLDAIPSLHRRLDYVICSHDHDDHYGGLVRVLGGGYTAGAVWHCGLNAGFGLGTPIQVGAVIDLGDGAFATCVGANGHYIDGAYVAPTTDKNTRSVALLVEYGDFDYLTSGDTPGTREDDLAGALVDFSNAPGDPRHPGEPFLNPDTGVDVLHVNHHGSKTSSTAAYLNALKPEVALISAGTQFSHPTQDAVDRLLGRASYSACSSSAGQPTGVAFPGAAVYRTTASGQGCPCALEADCPSVGDIVITTDGGSGYTLSAGALPPAPRAFDESLLDGDSDDDGLTDAEEYDPWGTDPHAPDSDVDGYTDFMEAMCGGDPNDADSTPHALTINFQPDSAEPPEGAIPATEAAWSDGAAFGWVE